jgi:transposase
MSERFDDRPRHKPESKRDAAVGAAIGFGRMELIAGGSVRRRWSSADKARIVSESLQPGANVSEVARRHGLSPGQVFGWRRKAHAVIGRSTALPGEAGPVRPRSKVPRPAGKPAADPPAFAPVVMATPAVPLRPAATATSVVEIAIGEVSVRIRGVVDVEALVAVLSAVRRAP